MTTLTLTANQLDVFEVWALLRQYDINLSINEIIQQGSVALSDNQRIIVKSGKLMLEVL